MAKLDFSDLIPQQTGGGDEAKSSGPISFDDLVPNTSGALEASAINAGIPREVLEGERLAEEKAKKYATPLPGQTRVAPQQEPAPTPYTILPTRPMPDVQELGEAPQRPLERTPGFGPPVERPAPRQTGIPLPPTGRPAYTLPTRPMPPVQPLSGAGESYREPFPAGGGVLTETPYAIDQATVIQPENRPSPALMEDYRRRFGPDITEDQVMEMRRGAAREDIVPRTLGRALENIAGADNRYFTLTGQESAEETARRRGEAKTLVPQAIKDTAANRAAIQDRIATLEGAIAAGNNSPQLKVALAAAKRDLAAQDRIIKEAGKEAQKIEQGPAVTQTQLGAGVQGLPQAAAEQTSDAITAAQRILTSPVRAMEAISGVPQDKSTILRVLREGDEERRQAILGQLNSDVALADDLGQKVVRGVGSTAGFAATGGALRAGLGLGMTAATAVGGALAQGEQGWKEAERRAQEDPEYASEWRKWTSFAVNLGIGTSEAAPIGLLFSRLERASGGGLTRWAGITAASMGEEGLQEGLQQLLQNANSIVLLGDPNITLTKDVADGMLVGALSGGIFAGTMAGGKMAFDAGRAGLPQQPTAALPPLPLNMQGQPTEFSMAPVQAPLTAGVQAPGPVSPAAPVEAQGALLSPTPPAATPQEVLAAAPAQSPEQPALEALREEAAKQFPPTQPEVEVLLGAGFAPADITDMSPQERLAEIRAAKAEGVTPVPLTPEQKTEFGFAEPAAPAPAPIAEAPQAPVPGTPLQNGFIAGPNNERFRVGEGQNGTVLYEKRYGGGSAASFYIGQNGQLIDAERVDFSRPETLGNLWTPQDENARESAVQLLTKLGETPSGSPERATILNQIKQLVAPEAAATPAAPPAVEEAKAPAPKKEGPLKPSITLPQFIASMGGIKDTDGELRARNLDRMMTGRYGPLVRQGGMKPEDALRAAIDAGYYTVPEREGAAGYQASAELLDQFYNDLGAKIRDEEDRRLEAEGAFDKRARVFTAENRRQIEQEVGRVADEFGIRDREAESMAADYIEEGTFDDPLVALEQATMHLGSQMTEAREVYETILPPEDVNEIQQGPAPQVGAGTRAEGERAERPAEEGRSEEVGRAAPEAGAGRPVEEAGAEGKPQLVIPGTEKISEAEQAQRGAEKPLKPSAPQKDLEGLSLFNDSSKQGDLLDMTAKAEEAQEKAPESVIKEENKGINKLNKIFTEHLQAGGSFKSITEARKMAEPTGITDPKIIEEALELAVVRTARGIVKEGGTSQAIYDKLVDLYQRQPKLNTRTSESVMNQAYSTPIPLAYLASRLAGIGERVTVYEPTAGNGALLIEADPKFTFANELNRVRRDNLKRQGFETVSGENAMNVDFDRDMSVIIANPPFGVTKDADGEPITFDMGFIQKGYRTREIDHAISLKALQGMEKDGRAVLIIGSVNPQASDRSAAYNGKAKREFFKTLYDNYNVADHFTVDGKLYDRQGASWPVDVIVIDGVGKSALPLPAVQPPRILTSWDQVKGELINERQGPTGEVVKPTTQPTIAPRAGVGEEGNRPAAERGERPTEQSGLGPDLGISQPSDQGQRGVELPAEPSIVEPGERIGQPERFDLAPTAERRRVEKAETETEKQVAYEPLSTSGKSLGTLVPVNMRTSTQDALQNLAEKRGNIDAYVANRLGYDLKEIGKYLSAEQIDAIALAIDNFERGAGFIIGDQTGIGKGRVNAAIIRYAIKNKLTPIFVTEKPNLYQDMYRDMTDIGLENMLGRPLKMMMTNANMSFNLTDDGSKKLTSLEGKKQDALLKELGNAGNLGGRDLVFTTYNQMQTVKGSTTERQRFLRAIAPNSILILDESHNAGGQGAADKSDEEGMNRAAFVRELVNLAKSVFYSSATYAKRPDVMDLYSKTDMALAVDSLDQLAEAIQKGGIPMQQVVASQLAETGQYIRRERSYAGVSYDTPVVPVNRDVYNSVSSTMAAIHNFSKLVKAATKEISKELRASAKMAGLSQSVGDAGAESTSFSSVMHNLINQMLLSIKANSAANLAIDSLKNGEKPVITVANTMESFLKEYQEENDLKIGDPITIDFGGLLKRYLEKTRTITVKNPFMEKGEKAEKVYLTDSQLGPTGLAAYKKADALIDSIDFGDLPVSPIDWIRYRLQKAGYSVAEITGREVIIDYGKPTPVLATKPKEEKGVPGRSQTRFKFNNGDLDAIILNQSGATGISLHASETFKDQSKRHMIIAQPENNIDTHMQMLGRVHRTGQTVTPRYSQVIADIPAEKRPAAVLAKKMASLSANTTGSRKGALSAEDVPDFMNKYGDRVAMAFLRDNPEVRERLGLAEENKLDEPIKDLTGKIPLLSLAEQEELYELLESSYKDLIEQLESQGVNTLEAATLDLGARLKDQRTVKEGTGTNPFTAAVNFGLYDVKRLGKPMDMKTAIKEIAKANGLDAAALPEGDAAALTVLDRAFTEKHAQVVAETNREFNAYMRNILDDTDEDSYSKEQKRLFDIKDRWENLANLMIPGKRVRVVGENGESYLGVVVKVARSGKTKNPMAPSAWRATVVIPSPSPMITIPFSQISPNEMRDEMTSIFPAGWAEGAQNVADVFNQFATSDVREPRVIATGNILSGFDILQGRGTIVNFTTDDGQIKQGIMLPASIKTLDDAGAISRKKLDNPAQVIEALQMAPGEMLTSRDRNVVLKMKRGVTVVIVPKAKDKGGKYYLDKKLIDMAGNFYSAGRSNMNTSVYNNKLPDVVQRLMDLGAIFDGAESDVKPSFGLPQSVVSRGQRELTDIRKEVEDIAKRVVGRFGQVSVVDRIDQKVSERAAREAGYMGPAEGIPQPVGLAIPPDQDGVARLMVALTDNALPTATAYHEADHVLEMMGAFTPQENKIRDVAVDRLRNNLIEAGLPAEPVMALVPSEVLALSFELYGAGRDIGLKSPLEVGPALKRVFQKVGRFIEAVRNMLAGRGFRTVEDLFNNAYIGRFAERAEKQIEQSGFGPRQYEAPVARPSFSNQAQQYVQQLNATHGAPAPRTPAQPTFAIPESTNLAKATRAFQDEFVMQSRIQKVIEEFRGARLPEGQNAYMAAMLFPGRYNARLEDFREKSVEPIIKAMSEEGLSQDDVGLYLYARHARERNDLMAQRDPNKFGTDGGSGMMNGTADEILERFDTEGKTPALRRIARMVDQILDADLTLRLASGLISQQTYDQLKEMFKNYVPLKGFAEMDDGESLTPRIGKGLSVSKREFQTSTGRFSMAANPLVNVILQAEEGIIRAEKNRPAKALLRLAQQNPNPDLWEINKVKMKRVLGEDGLVHYVPDMDMKIGDNVVVAKIGGVPHYIVLHNEMLAQAWKKLGAQALSPIVANYAKVQRFFSSLMTSRNPEFVPFNGIRDIEDALFTTFADNTKLAARVIKRLPQAFKIAAGNSINVLSAQDRQYFDEWRLAGGRISYAGLRSAEDASDEINATLRGLEPIQWGNLSQKAKDSLTKPVEKVGAVLDKFSQPVEDATRLAVYLAARESGYTPNQAALMAREATTDFYKKGAYTSHIGAFKMFFNASMQGNVKYIVMLATSKRARIAYASFVPMGFMMTMFNLMRSGDDPEEKWKKNYVNIQDYERSANIIIKTGPGQNDYFKIPLAFGLKIPYYLGEQMALVLAGQVKPQTAAMNVLTNTVTAFNPLGEKGNFFNWITPSLLNPFLEMYTNQNAFNRPIVPEKRPYNEGVPQSQQSFRSNSSMANWLADAVNSATGGTKYRPGAIDLYPGWIDHTVKSFTAGLGTFTGNVYNYAYNSFHGIPTPTENIPFVRRFSGPDRTAPGESFRYYEMRKEFDTKANELRKAAAGLAKNPQDQEARQTVRELGKELGGSINARGTIDWQEASPISILNRTDKMLAEYRKQLDAVKNNKQLTPVARDTRNRQIEAQIERVQKLAQNRLARFTDRERKPGFAPLREMIGSTP